MYNKVKFSLSNQRLGGFPMKKQMNKRWVILAASQVLIFAISFINYHNISLLSYINISFYISAALLLTSLVVFTIRTGFFDTIARSFSFSASRGKNKKSFDEITPVSELVSFNQKPLLFYGLVIGLFMLIALACYYVLQT
jgi:hypothetical protein